MREMRRALEDLDQCECGIWEGVKRVRLRKDRENVVKRKKRMDRYRRRA